MNFPVYWARHDFTARDHTGRPVTRTALGWSAVSQAEADAHAMERARRAASRAASGELAEQYEYGQVPVRELIVGSLSDSEGQTFAVVTRNRYGAAVLNTDRVLFVDIDRPYVEVREPGWLGVLRRALGIRKFAMEPEEPTLQRVLDWHRAHPGTSMRIYRTCAGLRLLFTDRQYDPTDLATLELLESLGSDRLYILLTKNQQTFRARLSPKPWRCGVERPRTAGAFLNDPDWPKELAGWVERYEQVARDYATCQFVQSLGSETDDEVIEQIIAYHDHETLNDGRPLA